MAGCKNQLIMKYCSKVLVSSICQHIFISYINPILDGGGGGKFAPQLVFLI